MTKFEEWPETKREFRPLTFVSTINLDKGRYPDLFSRDSYAVWVDPEVAALKRSEAVAAGEEIDPNLDGARYLLGKAPLPAPLPDYYTPGDASEAQCYAAEAIAAWHAVPGAIDWLTTMIEGR